MKPLHNIFSVVPDCHVPIGHYQVLWQRHFYEGLRAAVKTLVTPERIDFAWARPAREVDPQWQLAQRNAASERLWEQILSAHRDHGLDAVISYCFGHDLNPDLVRQTIQMGVPWINFFCDSTHAFEKVEALARVTSLNWFPEHAAIPAYRALGRPLVCLPYALNPACLPDCGYQQGTREAVFVGLPTTNRITQLGILRLLGCRVEIRGYGWVGGAADPFQSHVPASQRLLKALFRRDVGEKIVRRLLWPWVKEQAGGPLEETELVSYLQASQAVLGLNQGRDEQGRFRSYLKFRDLEFPGYGCCYLTEHNDDVASALEPGREILTYRNLREAAGWLRQIRRDPDRFSQIGRAGRQRVMAAHTWAARLNELAAAW